MESNVMRSFAWCVHCPGACTDSTTEELDWWLPVHHLVILRWANVGDLCHDWQAMRSEPLSSTAQRIFQGWLLSAVLHALLLPKKVPRGG
jgi:hypothetical protein